jgi:hypothetical protein
VSRTFCNFSMSFLFVIYIYIYIKQLSAKNLTLELMVLQISITYTRNGRGIKTLHCGTPVVTLTTLDSCPPTTALCVRPTRNSLTQTATLEHTREAASCVSSRSCVTKNKALEKSIIIASIPTPSSRDSAMSWLTAMT